MAQLQLHNRLSHGEQVSCGASFPRLPILRSSLFCILLLHVSAPAHADLVICNQSDETVYASYLLYESSNDAWTAHGYYGIEDNECESLVSSDLNEKVYFYATVGSRTTHPLSGTTTSWCINQEDAFEIVWDGDSNNPYYKDLNYRSDRFRPCTSIGSSYKEVGFREITAAERYDHCVVSLGDRGSFRYLCWD